MKNSRISSAAAPRQLCGTVIRSTGSWYTVRVDVSGLAVACKVKGNFRLRGIRSTNPVAVGDRVHVIEQDGTGFITDICPRRNLIVRKASNLSKQSHILAANLDMALLVVTVAHPETSTVFIDRFLAGAEAYRIPVTLVFNKVDLYTADDVRYMEALQTLYTSLGYACVALSAASGQGCDALEALLRDKVTLLSGNSGVGKSTLANRLIPNLDLRVAAISEAHDTGMHTTTFSEMYTLPFGGALIDTPGIKGFGTFDIEREEVSHYFREIFRLSADCRFGVGCTHTHEPGCAVREALEAHHIAASRYASYLSMLDDKDEDKYRPAY